MPNKKKSKKSKGKRRAHSTPEIFDLPSGPQAAPMITLRRSQAVRTIVAFPSLGVIAKGLAPYLNPLLGFDLDRSLYSRLTTLILDASPRLQEALSHIHTCRNADLISLATHISFLFYRVCPQEFRQYFGTEGWYWLRDQPPPPEPFGGLQEVGDPIQVDPPTFPDVICHDTPEDQSQPSSEDEIPSKEPEAVEVEAGVPEGGDSAGKGIEEAQTQETLINVKSEDVPLSMTLAAELFPSDEEVEDPPPAAQEITEQPSLSKPLTIKIPAKANRPGLASGTGRPETVLNHAYLRPPPGIHPRVAAGQKKAQKHDNYPHVEAPGVLPIYKEGPLFLQSSALRELTLPVNQGPVPSWVRPSCGQCASHGLVCTGGDFLNHVRCNQCAALKQTCGFDTRIPRFTSSQQLAFAGEASPLNISSLVADALHLRAMAQIAASHAEDLQKMTEAKLATLSLILQRVYSSEGDEGLNTYIRNVQDFEELLNFAKDIPLDTPMRFPERLHATVQQPDEMGYRWITDYQSSIYHNPPSAPAAPPTEVADDLQGGSFYADEDAMETNLPQQAPQNTTSPIAGPSTFPGALETSAASGSGLQAGLLTQPSGEPAVPGEDTSLTVFVSRNVPPEERAGNLYELMAPLFHSLIREAEVRHHHQEA
ncbi:hypothetical protein EST38_g6368 [Candolleomyces aberdarensis]|uniref:Uncharacterized protein n=1 Tax=Candolleomyces aberdarensis TaxID=2316362 RepID=A0A4Q2DJW4_9AGAR|nr:hypothetical protein EST38_g6368 [Candolleomyces aberdarensis]